jgi:hypothetical protein
LAGDGRRAGDRISVFSGFANSHRVLGTGFHPEILHRYEVIDHALLELFYDLLAYQDYRKELRRNHLEFFDTAGVYCLLTAASERYVGTAARIPSEEIGSLATTYDLVITGEHFLLSLLALVRPGIIAAIRNTFDPRITGATDYIPLSVDHVVNGLFRLSYEEISSRASEELLATGVVSGISVKKPGHLLYPIIRDLGIFAGQNVTPAYSDPSWRSPLQNRIVVKKLVSFLEHRKTTAYSQRKHDTEALLDFLRELLLRDHQDLGVALQKFRQGVRPVIILDGPGDTEEAALKQMLMLRRLAFRFIPAATPGNPEDDKTLDRTQLNFKIDGYDVLQMPDSYRVHESWEDGGVLSLICDLLKPPRVGTHNLLVDIHDRGGTSARYLDFEFKFGHAASRFDLDILKPRPNAF